MKYAVVAHFESHFGEKVGVEIEDLDEIRCFYLSESPSQHPNNI